MSERVTYSELKAAELELHQAEREYRRALATYDRLCRLNAEDWRDRIRESEQRDKPPAERASFFGSEG